MEGGCIHEWLTTGIGQVKNMQRFFFLLFYPMLQWWDWKKVVVLCSTLQIVCYIRRETNTLNILWNMKILGFFGVSYT